MESAGTFVRRTLSALMTGHVRAVPACMDVAATGMEAHMEYFALLKKDARHMERILIFPVAPTRHRPDAQRSAMPLRFARFRKIVMGGITA